MEEEDLSSVSITSRIRDVKEAIRVMDLEADLSLIIDLLAKLKRRQVPRRDKASKILHPKDMLNSLLNELSDVPKRKADNIKIKASWYRDALFTAFLVCRPIRLKNATSIELGKHLTKSIEGWSCHFNAEETKDGRPLSFDFPKQLLGPLEEYLDQYRPMLLGTSHSTHLWISTRGKAMAQQSLYCNCCALTARVFGHPINPHLFRDCSASALAVDDPEHILACARILGHTSLQTTNKHYNQSKMITAVKMHNDLLLDLKHQGDLL